MTKHNHRFGLVGKNISYSFSRGYFKDKFEKLGLSGHSYENFDLQAANEFQSLLKNNMDLKGLNVTIPYKQNVIPYLKELTPQAKEIGAVNTIQFSKNGLIGHNTDAYGFENSIKPFLQPQHTKALILGTGGASKAVAFVLDQLQIERKYVSRKRDVGKLSYDDLDIEVIKKYTVIINCTPLGTFPDVEAKPNIPYKGITQNHLLFDLIYNPSETAFLKEGKKRGAQICNGLRMLELQADRAWEIWQETF
ncbi:shikimate dehydrogenase [Cytophaga sp. FL35]|uniref:shikimate dehydrogenase family protein n=1 Tax=Cytophaga sp. FL35 TaxID=1904456 RepID=UPI001653AF16|nr:shikimate dehydrogenase [Cytophaga sp. FL35]MBC6997886.1 shikimate dehydrogenase [Cytophaga sp. FL35]